MGRGALRGVFGAWLGLIALQAVSTRGGSGRIVELFGDVNAGVQRLLDPSVPLVPDRRLDSPSTSSATVAKTDRKASTTPNSRYGSADAAESWTTGRIPPPK